MGAAACACRMALKRYSISTHPQGAPPSGPTLPNSSITSTTWALIGGVGSRIHEGETANYQFSPLDLRGGPCRTRQGKFGKAVRSGPGTELGLAGAAPYGLPARHGTETSMAVANSNALPPRSSVAVVRLAAAPARWLSANTDQGRGSGLLAYIAGPANHLNPSRL